MTDTGLPAEDSDASTRASEIELKFDLDPASLKRLAVHPALAGRGQGRTLSAVYYDTPDLALRAARLTLRVRKTGKRLVQTVKRGRPSDLFNRDEWEAPLKTAEPDFGLLAETPVADVFAALGDALRPVFTTTVRRIERLVQRPGAVIEVVVDKGEVRAGLDGEPVCELELELKAGDPSALYALARELFALAPMRLSLTSKSERGYRLLKPGLTGKASTPALTPDMTVSDAFAAVARSCLMQITAAADGFHRRPRPEAIHQTRIGVRRMRTALKLFKAGLSDDRHQWIVRELNWLTKELGAARSLDVFLESTFTPARPDLSDPDAARRYGVRLAKARAEAYGRAGAAIASDRFAGLTFELALWVEQGAWRATINPDQRRLLDSAIGPFAIDALDHLRSVVRRRGEHLRRLDPDHRHALRIRAKRLRYATDFFAEALGEDAPRKRRKFAGALAALQDSLGRLNDIAQARESALAPLGGRPSGALAFTAGELTGWARSRQPKALDKAADAYEDFTRARRFWPKPDKAAPSDS